MGYTSDMPHPNLAEIKQKFPTISIRHQLIDGGQKRVYAADHSLYGTVALKLISETESERVLREIEIATKNRFKNVPEMFETGKFTHSSGESIYIIEQFIEGETLREYLRINKVTSLKFAVDLLSSLLNLAVELEKSNVIHRDIKPENIIVDNSGNFWVLDFGIARMISGGKTLTSSSSHFAPATPGYAPPEQYRNVRREIDIRVDLFAIGVVSYECLTGQNPFLVGAKSPLDVFQLTETLVPKSVGVPGDKSMQLSGFISILMDKFPSRRPNNAVTALSWFESVIPTLEF